MKLYPHQQELINQVRQAYKNGYKNPCIVSGCGSGKSVMIAYIIKQMTDNHKYVLFLVHRYELKQQIHETLEKFDVNMAYVHLGMVQSVVRKLDTIQKPALIVTDESHHSLANSYRKIYDYFTDVRRLHFTATPVRLNGDGLGEVNDILVEGKSVRWLIENNYLSPYKCYAPKLIDDAVLKTTKGEYSATSIDLAFQDKKIYGDVIKYYRLLSENKQAIVYCHSIKQSQFIASVFNKNGITAEHIDGTTASKVRDKIIQDFRDMKITILCNVDLIGEGFNVPDCETVILLRPTQSLSLHIQQSMRSMRYKPNKQAIIIDHVGNTHRHGLPDMERTWSLKKKDKKRTKKQNTISLKTCACCYQVYSSKLKQCIHCGHIPETQVKELEVDSTAELMEVKPFKIVYKTAEDCKTLYELQQLAKLKGYKSGWAWHQAKLRKMI